MPRWLWVIVVVCGVVPAVPLDDGFGHFVFLPFHLDAGRRRLELDNNLHFAGALGKRTEQIEGHRVEMNLVFNLVGQVA